MPQVKLKMPRFLRRGSEDNSTDIVEILITASKGESIFELVRRLVAEDTVFRKDIFDEKNQMIETNIIVILNGRIINPYERSNTILQEGDEVTFVSMLYGG
jgi:molybdopterin converting factor small subunit